MLIEFTNADTDVPVLVESENILRVDPRHTGEADKGSAIRMPDNVWVYVKETLPVIKAARNAVVKTSSSKRED